MWHLQYVALKRAPGHGKENLYIKVRRYFFLAYNLIKNARKKIKVNSFQEAINVLICILGRSNPFHDLSIPMPGRMTNNRIVGAVSQSGKVVRFDWDDSTGSHINVLKDGQRYNINWGHEGSDDYLWCLKEINGSYGGNAQRFLNNYKDIYFDQSIYNQMRNLL